MSRALGFQVTTDPSGKETIRETFTCPHCGRPTLKPRGGEDNGWCHMCFRMTCIRCGKIDRCVPFEKRLERIEARAKLLNAARDS